MEIVVIVIIAVYVTRTINGRYRTILLVIYVVEYFNFIDNEY